MLCFTHVVVNITDMEPFLHRLFKLLAIFILDLTRNKNWFLLNLERGIQDRVSSYLNLECIYLQEEPNNPVCLCLNLAYSQAISQKEPKIQCIHA